MTALPKWILLSHAHDYSLAFTLRPFSKDCERVESSDFQETPHVMHPKGEISNRKQAPGGRKTERNKGGARLTKILPNEEKS